MSAGNTVTRRPISAEAAIMNPVSKVVALRGKSSLHCLLLLHMYCNPSLRRKAESPASACCYRDCLHHSSVVSNYLLAIAQYVCSILSCGSGALQSVLVVSYRCIFAVRSAHIVDNIASPHPHSVYASYVYAFLLIIITLQQLLASCRCSIWTQSSV
jgi:hypothetical protein